MSAPIIILVRPQMGENIGAVARAMSNFGLSELRIVAPRDGWPNSKAWEMASGGKPIIESAHVFPDFVSAMHDISYSFATTARPRDMEKQVYTPKEGMEFLYSSPNRGEARRGANHDNTSHCPHPTPPPYGEGIAFVFGPERTGLENEEITWCDAIIEIPTAPENFSLNLAQASVIIGYEWFTHYCHSDRTKRVEESHHTSGDPSTSLGMTEGGTQDDKKIATKAQWDELFTFLEPQLEEAGYFRVAEKKPIMWQNMRTSLLRSAMNEQELRSFRGALRLLAEGRKPRT